MEAAAVNRVIHLPARVPISRRIPMTIEQVRNLYGVQPFQPFVIHLADGRAIEVASREFLASAPSGRTVIVYQPDDSWNVIDLLLVTDLEVKRVGGASRRGRAKSG
jgi:hypothetical protein